MGFRPVGVYRAVGYKLGAWHDVGWWDLRPAGAAGGAGRAATDRRACAARRTWDAAIAAGQALLRPDRFSSGGRRAVGAVLATRHHPTPRRRRRGALQGLSCTAANG